MKIGIIILTIFIARSFSIGCIPEACAGGSISTLAKDTLMPTTQMLEAIRGKDQAAFQRLLKRGIDVNDEQFGSGLTPIGEAVGTENQEMVKVLFEHGATVNYDALCAAKTKDMLELVLMDRNAPIDINARASAWGPVVLTRVAGFRDKDIIELFLNYGANVNPEEPAGYHYNNGSPLTNAAKRGRVEIVELLIRHGARVDAVVGECTTGWDHYNVRETALCTAARSGHKETVELLLNKGADKGIPSRREKVEPWLLDNGLIEMVCNGTYDEGKTASELARENGHNEVAEIIENFVS